MLFCCEISYSHLTIFRWPFAAAACKGVHLKEDLFGQSQSLQYFGSNSPVNIWLVHISPVQEEEPHHHMVVVQHCLQDSCEDPCSHKQSLSHDLTIDDYGRLDNMKGNHCFQNL